MTTWFALVRRDLARDWRSGRWWLPVAFFILVATLYPFAVGPDGALLRRTGAGMLWVAALLAALLPLDRLFAEDAAAGVLDQLVLRGLAEESIAAARLVSHSLSFGLPLLAALLPAAALLDLDGPALARLAISLAIGMPALAGLGVMIAAMVLGVRHAGALGGLLLLPLSVPVLIFGAGSLGPAGGNALLLLAMASLLLVAITPFAAGAALRSARED